MAGEAEAPGLAGPGLGGIVDADSRRRHDRGRLLAGRSNRFQAKGCSRIAQVGARPAGVEPEGRRHQARATGQPAVRDARDPLPIGSLANYRGHPSAGDSARDAIGAHPIDAFDRLDRADQEGGRGPFRLGHHVEAGMHPVDKVHVGVTRRPEHHPVALRLPEAGMGREIVAADIGLDLHDPAGPPSRGVIANQQRPEQGTTRLERGPRQERPVEDAPGAQRNGYVALIVSGTNSPISAKLPGIRVLRNRIANWV